MEIENLRSCGLPDFFYKRRTPVLPGAEAFAAGG